MLFLFLLEMTDMLRRTMLMWALAITGMCLASPVNAQKDKKDKDAGPGIAFIKLKGSLTDSPSGMPNPLTGSSGDTLLDSGSHQQGRQGCGC